MTSKPSAHLTTGQLAASEITESLRPEWLRIPTACRISGLGRSFLYDQISSGAIRSVCVRSRGSLKGVRLISFDSLMRFIETAGNPEAAAK